MILGDPKKWDEYAADGVYGEQRLDALLRSAARDYPDEIAVAAIDSDGKPSELTWAALDKQADALAGRCQDMGLKADDAALVVMGSSAAALAVLFALSRAGMIAVTLSPAHGANTLADIAKKTGAKAVFCDVTTGPRATGDVAAAAAMHALDIRFVFGFNGTAPDGVIPGDALLAAPQTEPAESPPRGGRDADHVFALTLEGSGEDAQLIARNHGQLTACALPVVEAARLTRASLIVCAFAPCSLAALSGVLVPWLLSRCTLGVVPSWRLSDLSAFAWDLAATHVVVPGGWALDDQSGALTQLRIWRNVAHENLAAVPGVAIDVVSLGEGALNVSTDPTRTNLIALRGLAFAGSKSPVFEPRVQGLVHRDGAVAKGDLLRGPLALRGAGTPVMAYPCEGADAQRFAQNGFMVTRLRAELCEAGGPAVRVLGSMQESAQSGGVRIALDNADTLFASLACVADAAAYAVDHAVLGQALGIAYVRGESEASLETISAELDALGAGLALIPQEAFEVAAIPRDGDGKVRRSALLADRAAG